MTDAGALRRWLDAACGPGRIGPTEADGLDLLESIGVAVPVREIVDDVDAVGTVDLERFPGDRVVVKVLSPDLAHKSDVGGVAIAARHPGAVRGAIARMSARLPDVRIRGWLVCEFVPHDDAPGAQLLVSLRRTPDFGPVVTIGAGGVLAEALASSLRPDRAFAIAPADVPPESWPDAVRDAATVPLAIDRQRGTRARMDAAKLGDVLRALATLADADRDGRIRELEINPLVAAECGPVALDALLAVGGPERPGARPRPLAKLRRMVRPGSIAVMGVSARGANPGRIILRNIVRAGYPPDRITIVKPGPDRIEGVRCVPGIDDVPGGGVDLLILAIDAGQVPDVVATVCERRRAESIVVIPGGLGETAGTEDRARRIRETLAIARESEDGGPVVNGGNCLGIRSRAGRYDTLFIPPAKLPAPASAPSPLAVLSQSGAFGITLASRLGSTQPDLLVTFGNQTDLTIGDWMAYIADEPALRVIACYVEGFRPGDGRRFLDGARTIHESGRTVILYRAGRTRAGARAAASHTASIAGDWATTRALAERVGVRVAPDLTTFHDLIRTFTLLDGRIPAGRRLGAMSNAGFECVAIADSLGPLRLAAFEAGTRRRLTELLAGHRLGGIVSVRNPLDVTPMLDDAGFVAAAETMLDDPTVDAGLIGCVPLTGALSTLPRGSGHGEDLAAENAVAAGLVSAFHATSKPCVAVVDAGRAYDPLADALERGGLPTFRSADRALFALGAFVTRYAADAGSSPTGAGPGSDLAS